MIALVPALAGALVTGGVMLLVWALIPRPEAPAAPRRTSLRQKRGLGAWWGGLSAQMRLGVVAALLAGVVIAVWTGLVLAVVILPLCVVAIPYLVAAPTEGRTIERLEGIAEWTRNLASVLTVGVGLEQALIATLRSTPPAIRDEVGRLAARLQARWTTEAALRAFADDLDDPTGDMVAAALLLSARKRGAGLASVLSGLASAVAEDVSARRKIEADRAKPRSTARIATLVSAVVLVALAFTGQYMAPYTTPVGQIVLGTLLALYAAVLVWMRRMTQGKPLPRFLSAQAGAGA
ncbi:type II secretion system F family protein [Propioniciclava soli]|uniref:type II secretion system F family protein n=1 Tax=Propioniciclava soli TaxID=2775081 RepID=UPI001E53C149|nr:type II secretion system F family protein [Propioniciclava soli]